MEIAGYAPRDLLLFSAETYWRLFALQSQALWPWPLAVQGLGLAALALAFRPRPWSGRALAALLAAGWASVAAGFLATRYAPVNWAVDDAIPLAWAQAAALLLAGTLGGRLRPGGPSRARGAIGAGLLAAAVVAWPLFAPLSGRPLMGAEIAGLAPDPTAVATLGVLALAQRGAWAWALAAVPLLWCLASAAVLLTLGSWQGWALLAAAMLSAVALALPRRQNAEIAIMREK